MIEADPRSKDRWLRQEAEANRFSIELLAPRKRASSYLRGGPDLRNVIAMACEFDISREAAARRYVELRPEPLAVVFSREGRLLYAQTSDVFPRLAVRKGALLPDHRALSPGSIESWRETNAEDWLWTPGSATLRWQALHQENACATTLLALIGATNDDDELDDVATRFDRFG
jgi:hypothetical protein